MNYADMDFKIPIEDNDYEEDSNRVVRTIEKIINETIKNGRNKIIINTNLKLGLPLENINKIAGPMVEAWAQEIFTELSEDPSNPYQLINVEAQHRLGLADVVLQFRKNDSFVTGNVDVKATAEDIEKSGKGPNITSFSRIRSAYIADPNFMFIILSLKHKVRSVKNSESKLMDGVMEIVNFNAYDIKFLSDNDINYNPALGTGQIQIKDIHYVTYQYRTTWEFCQLLDAKYLRSSKRNIEQWYNEAVKKQWIKNYD